MIPQDHIRNFSIIGRYIIIIAHAAYKVKSRLARAVFIVAQKRLADVKVGGSLALAQAGRAAQLGKYLCEAFFIVFVHYIYFSPQMITVCILYMRDRGL